MNTWTSYPNRRTTPEEQCLYSHLLGCAAMETPEELLTRFRSLFIDGVGYPDRSVVAALDQILMATEVESYYRYVLNRCCHILINRWQVHAQYQYSIPELIQLFESSPSRPSGEFSRGRSVRRLRRMAHRFKDTEQYLALQRLARVIRASRCSKGKENGLTMPLGSLISRYPYLYEHCLLTQDSDLQQQQHVRRMQIEGQHRFEIDLSHYVNYRMRQARLGRQGGPRPAKALISFENPTLLSDRDLVASIKQFSVHRPGYSYQDLAHRFMFQGCRAPTYGIFKSNLYDYICSEMVGGHCQRPFSAQLDHHLKNTFPDSDDKPVNDFLIVRTCRQLLNFLVVDASAGKQHYIFVDLLNVLGPLFTTGLLLRILLVCRKVKPHLERQLSVLFNHYESTIRENVVWLVDVLETFNIALSLNFGRLDLSHVLT